MPVVRKEQKTEASWRPGKRGILHAAASVGGTEKLLVNESWNERGIGAPSHVHPDGLEEIIMVVEGKGEFWINGEHSVLEAGDLVIIPPYAHHGFKSVSDEVLHVIAIFSSPTAPTIYDGDPDRVVEIGGTQGEQLDTQRVARQT